MRRLIGLVLAMLVAGCASHPQPLTVTPAVSGEPNTIVLTLPENTANAPERIDAALDMVEMSMPIHITLNRVHERTYEARNVQFLMSGRWRIAALGLPKGGVVFIVR